MNSLPLVVWNADGHQFALETGKVNRLIPYDAELACLHLHQLMPELHQETANFCLGWSCHDQQYWLTTQDEPLHYQLALEQLWPLPASLQLAKQHPAIRALAWMNQRPLLILDPYQLV